MEVNGKSLPPEKKNMLLFMMLVQQYERIAKMNLGEIPNPAHNQIEVDLKSARFAVDTLEMLQAYTRQNLNADTVEYLENILKSLKVKLKEKDGKES